MHNEHEHTKHDHHHHEHKDHHGDQDGVHGGGSHGHGDHHAHMIRDFRNRFFISLFLTLPLLFMAPMIQDLLGYSFRFQYDRYVQFALSTALFLYGGWPFLKGLADELGKRQPGMMTLIALAISVAYIYSSAVVFGLEGRIFFWELGSLIVVMLLGHWVEMKAVSGASNALEELAALLPTEALLLDEDGNTRSIPVDELEKDDLILVKPGEKVPADGVIEEGESHVNESLLTGESMPVAKGNGDGVIGGSINQKGSLKVRISNTGDDAYLSRVMHMVEEAQSKKSKTQNLANKAAGWLFYVALGSGIITFTVWLNLGRELTYAMERMVTVMVISCPHALGLAIPLVAAISTSLSARHGLLVRNRTAFENARKITTLLFDKTGTLTKGEFGVTRFKSTSEGMDDRTMLQTAAAIEHGSEHPIAAGILSKARDLELEQMEAEQVESITGKGIRGKVKGKEFLIASPAYLGEKEIKTPDGSFDSEAETVVFLLSDGNIKGYIALADEVREDASEAIKKLKKKEIRIEMVTGDNEDVAKAVSDALGLDGYHASVRPEDKQSIIRKLQDEGEFVAMTGDGINDAPALAQADVGIAVGSGTDLAAESADIVLVNSKPGDIANLILFGTATYRKMVQNLFWAAGYNIFAIPLAAGVLAGAGILLSPAAGAVLMSLSTVVVAVNAQLLKRKIRQ